MRRHAPQARMVGARWQCYLSSITGLGNSPPLAPGRAAGGLVGTIWAGPLFIPRQKRAVIALAKPAAPQCAGGKVTVAERANFTIQLNQTPSVLVAFVGPFLKMESIATASPTATRQSMKP